MPLGLRSTVTSSPSCSTDEDPGARGDAVLVAGCGLLVAARAAAAPRARLAGGSGRRGRAARASRSLGGLGIVAGADHAGRRRCRGPPWLDVGGLRWSTWSSRRRAAGARRRSGSRSAASAEEAEHGAPATGDAAALMPRATGQLDDEAGPVLAVGAVLDPRAPAVEARRARPPGTGRGRRRRGAAPAGAGAPGEAVEDQVPLVLRDTRAAVLDGDAHAVAGRLHRHPAWRRRRTSRRCRGGWR